MKIINTWILCVFALILATGCLSKSDPNAVLMNDEAEMKSLDPQLLTDHSAIEIAGAIWEGLTRTGKDGKVIPGVAEKWEQKGNIWTFYLRKDAKWSNGDPVTADDFFEAIRRACDSATAAEYSYMMFCIRNAEAFNSKKIKDFTQVGVKVINPTTLQIELGRPITYFPSLLAFPTYYPVPAKFIASHRKDYALTPDKALYNGPWKIAKWIQGDRVDVTKNEFYWNKNEIKIEKISYLFIRDSNTAVNMYKNGQLDLTVVSGDKLDQFKGNSELKGFAEGTVGYFEFNVKNKFFANKKIRRAFALAIDRKEYMDRIAQDGSVPAYSFVPSVIPGKSKMFREEYGLNLFVPAKPDEAKKLLMEGLREIGFTGTMKVSLLTDNNDRAIKSSQYFQEVLRKNLGVEVTPDTVTFQVRLQRMQSKDFDFIMALWGPDYMDPMTYMDLWVTNGGNNNTNWSNPRYDAAIKTAQNSADQKVRMDAMASAEKILIEEMPVAPLYFRYRSYVAKPWLKGVVKRPFGQETDFYWATLEARK
jgi:oligopeptide transport system substrate-binding protein